MHEKILLSSFTVKAETRSIDKFSKRFLSLIRFVFSTIFIQNYDITSVSPIIQDISKFINLCKNSFGHLSSFTSRVPHWKTQAAPIVDVISESIVSHFSSFLSCVLTEQWVNFTAAYVTFENTSPSLSLSPWSNSYDPPPLWPIYPAALSGLWRPHDDVIVPLTSPPLPYVTIENNLVSIFPRTLPLLFSFIVSPFTTSPRSVSLPKA